MNEKKFIQELVREAIIAKKNLDKAKAAYKRWDEICDALIEVGLTPMELDGYSVVLVDNFKTKNKVWKAAGISRWDVEITKAK